MPRVPITASRSPITAVAVSSPPAPGPFRITSRIDSPAQHDRVERALDRGQRVVLAEQAGVDAGGRRRASDCSAEAISLTE